MGNTFDPELQEALGGLLGKTFMKMPKSKAEIAIEQAHANIAARQKAAKAKMVQHPRVLKVEGRVITVDFARRGGAPVLRSEDLPRW